MSAIAPNVFQSLKRSTFFKSYSKPNFNYLKISGLLSSSAAIAYAVYHYSHQNGNNQNQNQNQNNNNNGNYFQKAGIFGLGTAAAQPATNIREALATTQTFDRFQDVYNEIAMKLRNEDEYDDGSYGPVLVRLAWHASGTYDKNDTSDKKGGSYGGTMALKTEADDPANAGLKNGRDFLESIGKKYPFLSRGDLYTLGGVVAIQELGGPKIKWRPGRYNLSEATSPPYGRLPDASQESGNYIRSVFDKMGFNDREMVALVGAHALGRCHTTASGYDGPWTFSPTVFTNQFYVLLLGKWHEKKWDGPKQYEDDETSSLMMLPGDMAFVKDDKFKKYVEMYAKDEALFFKDFADAFSKLLELGIEFPKKTPQMEFKTLDEQDL